MIAATHVLIYAEDAEATRAFLRDVFGFEHVDAGDGWLIFALPPTELGVHPAEPQTSGRHELFFMCDDVERTVEELTAKGVEFVSPIEDPGVRPDHAHEGSGSRRDRPLPAKAPKPAGGVRYRFLFRSRLSGC